MGKIVKKLFFAWQMDQEKAFLEEMARKGYKLSKVGFGRYHFIEIEPTNLVYNFDFQVIGRKQMDEYLSLFEGWELCHRYGSWFYFCKEKTDDIEDSIFNDNDSKLKLFKRLLIFLGIVGFPLYYQVIIFMPNMDTSDLTFPNFYFFFRIVTLVFIGLHLIAVYKVFTTYQKIRNQISE